MTAARGISAASGWLLFAAALAGAYALTRTIDAYESTPQRERINGTVRATELGEQAGGFTPEDLANYVKAVLESQGIRDFQSVPARGGLYVTFTTEPGTTPSLGPHVELTVDERIAAA